MADSDALHELLQCSICLERFINPKVLPCQHTFCVNCLRGITKCADTLACPECRKDHRIPQNGVVDFEDNLTIKRLLGMVGEVSACFDCDRQLSVSQCQHCAELVCGDCRARHTELLGEIKMFYGLKLTGGSNVSKRSQRADGLWKVLLDRISIEKKRIPKVFEELELEMAKRKHVALGFLDTMEHRVRLILSKEQNLPQQFMHEQLVACKTTSALKEFKDLLDCSEETLAAARKSRRSNDFRISYDSDALKSLGGVNCGGVLLGMNVGEGQSGRRTSLPLFKVPLFDDPGKKLGTSGGNEALQHQEPAAAAVAVTLAVALPSGVNYEAKNSTPKIYIDRHPEAGKVLQPRYALYSAMFNSIFCMSGEPSNGQVLVYALDGSGGRVLSPLILAANHIALSDSGKLIIAERSAVTIVDLLASKDINSENALLQVELRANISLANQVCCYQKELIVLDSVSKNLLVFTEGGKYLRHIKVEQLKPDGLIGSKMAVDGNGDILFTNGIRTVDGGNQSKIEIANFSSKSGFSKMMKFDGAVPRTDAGPGKYGTSGTCAAPGINSLGIYAVPGAYANQFQQQNYLGASSPQQVRIKQKQASVETIRGFCVDGDGFICITKEKSDMIEVYDQNGQLHCTIGDPQGGAAGFKTPSGVWLMPDGRLIVCDTGNSRIQIM